MRCNSLRTLRPAAGPAPPVEHEVLRRYELAVEEGDFPDRDILRARPTVRPVLVGEAAVVINES